MDVDLSAVNDPEELQKLFDEQDGETGSTSDAVVTDPVAVVAEIVVDANKTNTQVIETKAGESQSTTDVADADGVATKDGKNIIPFSVLKNERERATSAEAALTAANERVQFLEALVQGGTKGAKTGESARTEDAPPLLTDEELESLKEDFPTVHKALKLANERAERLETQLKAVEEPVRHAQEQSQRSAVETVQDAIDSVPKLAHIQATDSDAFTLAKQFDATLREQPEWKGKPLQERFTKAVELVESIKGAITLPANTTTSLKPDELKAAAKAAAEKAATSAQAVPTSLSEFPAGQAVAKDEREAIENMSVFQVAEKLDGMSPDQMDAYFRDL